ncbi:hypothetical protein [Amycolatopsis alba]|uniref:Uncharacterized protein n=1 Tax=Amycolatopsis alba DSM 44262 TaxID=1125972 RepID=A0A229SA48_AMYAL|nr:hypothetical protein [Amycolatopsis alba]OXM55750.1 hypothetical protein CFP75_00020 [Amycolatopsis alba DSM 44262]
MNEQGQYGRYREDSKVLAAIGACVDTQVTRLTVRLPKALAEAAVAAWDRDELGDIGEETHEQYALRDRAGDLALIGLAISERGRWEKDEAVVDLDVTCVGAAVRASL